MKEFIEKLIGRLEEYKYSHLVEHDSEMIEHCKEKEKYCKGNDCFFCIWDKATEIVNQLAEEYNNGWIPCSQQMPPQPKENPIFQNQPLELYLVTERDADYPRRVFWNGEFFTDGWEKADVIAWQPLPKPYQPKGE